MSAPTIQGLREKLFTAKELADVADYFFDLMEDGVFVRRGKPHSEFPKVLEPVVAALAKRHLTGDVGLIRSQLVRVAEYGFVHGAIRLNELQGTLMLFEEDMCGLIALAWPDARSEFARFGITVAAKKPDRGPSAN